MAFPFQNPSSLLRDRLNDVIPGYRSSLEQQGLAPWWADKQARTAEHIVVWLTINDVPISDLDIRKIAAFVAHDCACPREFEPYIRHYTRSWADRFLGYLMDAGLVEMPVPIIQGSQHVDAFVCSLSDQGYRKGTRRVARSMCRHFIVWLYLSDLALDQIDDSVIQRFLDHECACSCPHFHKLGRFSGTAGARARIVKFADFLACELEIGSWRKVTPPLEHHELVDGFIDWMRRHRGARDETIRSYAGYLRRMVLPVLGHDPALYDVASIRTAFANWAESHSRVQLLSIATALRAYLRYLGANGICRPELAGAVPVVRRQRESTLPRYVGETDIEALIASCETAVPTGMRDRAILLLLARLALRAGDVVALRLSDINWDRAHVRVNGKSRHTVALPLSQEVGDALKAYILQGRPPMQSEFVFLEARAPYRALSSSTAVSYIVRRAMRRAGIDGEGLPAAHLFRHSCATHLLRGGASLETVATLLRHRSVETTTLYARVDRPMLLEVAQPWPGDAS